MRFALPSRIVAVRRVDRLHAAAAIDLHRERHHRLAHAEPQRGDARRIHLVGNDIDAAEDHLVEGIRREWLPPQQRTPALHGEIDRGERPRAAARFQERRAAAVDDIDRPRHQLAALCFTELLEELMHVGGLLVDRRQRLRREIVDLDHFRHRLLRRREPVAFGLRDHALLHRLAPVADVRGMHALRNILSGSDQQERLLQPRHAAVVLDMRQDRRQPVARRRRLQHQLRAAMDDQIRRSEHARAERLDQEFQDHGDEPVRQIGEDFRETVLDGLEARRHAPFEGCEIRTLTPLVLPALQRGREQIEFGQDIAEPRRQHFLALQRAAQRQQRHVGAQREGRRIARELPIESGGVAGIGRRRERAAAPAAAPGAEQRGHAVADVFPERLVERVEAFGRDPHRRAHSSPAADKDARGSRPGRTRSGCG